LDAQIARCQARLEEEIHRAAESESAGNVYRTLVHEFRRSQLVAMLEWLHTCKTRMTPPERRPPYHGRRQDR